jgi:hypothetical protein
VKEDVLEQIVEDYLQFNGYFTVHNVRFKPSVNHPDFKLRDDAISSDVDIVGYHPRLRGTNRVVAVSCKAWQEGFDATGMLALLRGDRKDQKRAKYLRELRVPKWSEAFRAKIKDLTGADSFSYRIAVTRLRGNAQAWETEPKIQENLPGCSVGFLTLETMWAEMLKELSTTPASSEIGRLAQLLKAAGLTAREQIAPPSPPIPGSDAARAEALEMKRDSTSL